MYKCLKCGRQYVSSVSFCEGCGSPVEYTAVCEECGAVLTGNETVCGNCGAPVEITEEASAPIEKAVCEECGAVLTGSETVCGYCGAPVGITEEASAPVVTAVCEECGAVLTGNETVCGNCGAFTSEASRPVSKENDTARENNKRTKTVFLIANILFVLTLIPSTVVFLGNIFEFNAVGLVEKSFSFFGAADAMSYVNGLLNDLEALGIASFDNARIVTGILSFAWIAVVIFLIDIVARFITGIRDANKGELLTELSFTPMTCLIICYVFSFAVDVFLLSPINNFISESVDGILSFQLSEYVNLKLSISLGSDIGILICIACFNLLLLGIMKIVEKVSERA